MGTQSKDVGNFVVDVGNTRIKSAVFRENKMEDLRYWETPGLLVKGAPVGYPTLVSNVRPRGKVSLKGLRGDRVFFLSHRTPLPIRLSYDRREDMGTDRISAAAGAHRLYPDKNCLVFALGTCFTSDVVTSEGFLEAGTIAPGFSLRMESLAERVPSLPDIRTIWSFDDLGFPSRTTRSSILNGVFQGMLGEMRELIRCYRVTHGRLQVVLCGGDAEAFGGRTGFSAQVIPHLVLYGLSYILDTLAKTDLTR